MDIITGESRSLPAFVGPAMPAEPPWRDRLVELHVLAEHGDLDAADVAARWMATDPDAQHAWSQVERTCQRLRTSAI